MSRIPGIRARDASRAALLVALLALAGCAGLLGGRSDTRSTSIVDYLYPDQKEPLADQGIPVLSLPMRAGIAFVPASYGAGNTSLSEARQAELLEKVAGHFRGRDFIKSLEVIPSAYLRPRGGFTNLDQLRTMHGIESIVLVSYDQTQFTEEGFASLVYWTIVGAYVISAEKNDTHTMVDAVVVHIPSRKMLFRAPGTSQVKGRSTFVNLGEELREDSDRGFREAVDRMIPALDQQLAGFTERVKSSPGEYQVARAPGYTGSGAIDARFALLLAALIGGTALWNRRRPR